jgi:glucokinase
VGSEATRTGSHDRVIAVDLGGTNLRVAVIGRDGTLTHRHRRPTNADQGPDAVLKNIAESVLHVAEAAGLPPHTPVGIASPGPINPRTGVVYFTPNLPGWRNVELTRQIAHLTGHPAYAANDANCAGLGEARFGAAQGATDMVYLGLGTGVGGAVISGGQLIDGIRGLGAELGHVCVSQDGPRCTCGAIGCLEAYTSGWAIAREATLVAATAEGVVIREEARGGKIDAAAVARAANAGDRPAQELLARAGRALGTAMGIFVNIFNPQLIVIGGGVAAVGEWLLRPASLALPSYSFVSMREDVRIVMAQLGDDAGLYGAATIAFSSGKPGPA